MRPPRTSLTICMICTLLTSSAFLACDAGDIDGGSRVVREQSSEQTETEQQPEASGNENAFESEGSDDIAADPRQSNALDTCVWNVDSVDALDDTNTVTVDCTGSPMERRLVSCQCRSTHDDAELMNVTPFPFVEDENPLRFAHSCRCRYDVEPTGTEIHQALAVCCYE